MTESVQDGVTTYTMTVSDYLRNWSDNLIISNGDDKQKTVSLANGSEYHTVPDQTFTVYFKNTGGWTKVYAYTHGTHTALKPRAHFPEQRPRWLMRQNKSTAGHTLAGCHRQSSSAAEQAEQKAHIRELST